MACVDINNQPRMHMTCTLTHAARVHHFIIAERAWHAMHMYLLYLKIKIYLLYFYESAQVKMEDLAPTKPAFQT